MRHANIVIGVVSVLFVVDSAIADDGGWYIGVGLGDVAAKASQSESLNWPHH